MQCEHNNSINNGETDISYDGTVYYHYHCQDCDLKFISVVAPDNAGRYDPSNYGQVQCTHTNAVPVREEMRKTECGKQLPTKIWQCPDCHMEFSVR